MNHNSRAIEIVQKSINRLAAALHTLTPSILIASIAIAGLGRNAVSAEPANALGVAVASKTRPADQSFVVTQKIYSGDDPKPVAHHRLIFDAGVTYDFPQIDSPVVTVYDSAKGEVTLIDQQKQIHTTVTQSELIEFTASVRAAAETEAQREGLGLLTKIIASDRLDGYSISFEGVQYDISMQTPKHRWMAADYGRFSNIAGKLNLLQRRGVPPFARMQLGERIALEGKIPLVTMLSVKTSRKEDHFRATATVGAISENDRVLIEKVTGMLTLYKAVSLARYNSPTAQ